MVSLGQHLVTRLPVHVPVVARATSKRRREIHVVGREFNKFLDGASVLALQLRHALVRDLVARVEQVRSKRTRVHS